MDGFARSGSVSIAYRAFGHGPDTLLLIVGLGGRSVDWGDELLEAFAARHRVVTFDNRGTGRSDKPEGWWTLEDMAADAVAVLDAVGTDKSHVLGHSMGGMIAQLVALDHPERVDKLVLSGTHFGGPSVVHPQPEILSVLQPARGTPVDEILRGSLRLITAPGFAERHPQTIERFVAGAVAAPTSKAAFSAQLSAMLSSDRSTRVEALRMPTLVVHGELDPLIPVANGIALAERIPGARLEILQGVGHLPQIEAPERLAELVNEFLV